MEEPNLYPIPLDCAPPVLPKFRLPPLKAGEAVASRSHHTYHCLADEHKVDIEENTWIKTVRQKVNEARPKVNANGPCTILQVPDSIRRCGNEDKAYTPIIATIGPYHYFPNQRGTARAMHEHKWRCVRYLLSRHQSRCRASQLLDQCLAALKALDDKVRNCYGGTLNHLDPPKLASIMLMDGCFIIHLMLKQVDKEMVDNEVEDVVLVSQEENKNEDVDKGKEKVTEEEEEKVELEMGKGEEELEGPLIGMQWIWNLVVFDLLKFDNQIPFFIIQTIFDAVKTPRDKNIDLVNLGLKLFRDIHPQPSKVFTKQPAGQIHHLLHLFHLSLVPCKHKSPAPASLEWIPSGMELKRAGMKFARKEAYESFLDVTYKDGILELPPLQVYDYSNSVFRNLIVYEQCFPDVGRYITNYAMFMERIVVAAEDAGLLSSKGILVNRLGTDEAVVGLFNRCRNQLHRASYGNYLSDVFTGVRRYHESKWRRWRAGFVNTYFSNRWTGVAMLVAVLLILLLIEQSFAAFSYFHLQDAT